MSGLPLRYVHQNLLVGDGDARAALYRVPTISYPFLPGAGKRDWLRRLARLAFAVEADLSLWRVNRAYPARDYVAQAEGMLDDRRQDPAAWLEFLASHQSHLGQMRLFVPEVYLAVSLRTGRRAASARARCAGSTGAAAPRSVGASLGQPPIPVTEPEALIGEEERLPPRQRLPGGQAGEHARVAVALRRAARRGLGEPALDPALAAGPRWSCRRRTGERRTSRSE